MFKKAQALIANPESNELAPRLLSNLLRKLPIVHQFSAALHAHSDRRSRRLRERSKKANRARYRRWLILGEPLEDRALLAGFTVSGSTLALNLTAANESVSITSAGSTYSFVLSGGTWSGTDGGGATGNGLATLTATAASFTGVTIDDSSTGNSANFNNSGANTYSSSFIITLDSTSPGTSSFTGTTAFSGSASLFVQSGGITASASSVVSVVNGNLSLIGNMQTPGRTGNFHGVDVNSAQVKSTGTGNVLLRGMSGISTISASGVRVQGTGAVTGGLAGSTLTFEGYGAVSPIRNEGVYVTGGSIAAAGGDIIITGVGGLGTGTDNKGFMLEPNTSVTNVGNGSITINGTAGGTNSNANAGVEMLRGTSITTVNGNITIVGIAGGGATGSGNRGVWVAGTIQSTGSGNVSVSGTGGPGSGGSNPGVLFERNGTGPTQEIKSGTGNVSVVGTTGGGTNSFGIFMNTLAAGFPPRISTSTPGGVAMRADSISILASSVISAPTVSIAPKTAGKNIDLGSTSETIANTLALSQTELNTITATTLDIGDASTAVMNVSAAITLPGTTALNLRANTINVGSNRVFAGSVSLNGVNQSFISLEQPAGTSITNGGTKSFGSVVVGSTADLVFTVKNPGSGDLTGLGITIDGTNAAEFTVFASPAALVAPGGSTTFTIRHAPVTAGNKTAAFHLTSNAIGVPTFDINLTASSLPDISVEQPAGTSIADGGTKGFGGVPVGSTADIVFTVKNPGTSNLAISGITIDGSNASEFSVIVAPSASVLASGSTTFTVRYAPTTIGSKTAALHIANNVAGAKSSYDINLTASSTPDISVEHPAGTAIADGSTKAFGGLPIGSSTDLLFTVRNPGTSDLAISGITFDGANANEFSVAVAPASSVSVSGTTTFTVRYTPTSVGSKVAALHVATNVPGAKSAYDINLATTAFSTAPISGTKTLGPTGDYTSLTNAIADIQGARLDGPLILELQPTYVSTVESFPLVFTNLGTTAVNTLTVRPATGATNLLISSANTTAATVDLNGAQFVTIDGRPGGTGTAKQLTIANTSTSGIALRFINEASYNMIKFATLQSVNSSATSGTVVFSTTTGTNGNDNNTLDTCDIRDGLTTPANGVYSLGSTGTSAQSNSGNTVSGCNIYNFYSSTGLRTSGVRLDAGTSDWTITGNSFYQTASRASVAEFCIPVYLNNAAGGNFLVSGNFIGGTGPQAGGTPWTVDTTTAAYQFLGIWMAVSASSPTSIQGNTVRNIAWKTSSNFTSGIWNGIDVSSGSVNIGTVTGNVIGSSTGTDSISVTTSGSGGTVIGINSNSADTVTIANNTIGSITANGSSTSVSASITGIRITAGTNGVSGNTIGSTSTANSLNAATSSTSTTGQQVTGILSSSTGSASITSNTVANLNNSSLQSTAGAGQIRGIFTSAGVNTITGNTVRNLSTTSQNANITNGQSVFGIIATSGSAGQTVSQNTVHSLANTAATAAVNVTGIYIAGLTSGTNVIARNFVHSLAVSSSSTSSVLNGMQFVAGTFTAQNNMVRVGLKADGISTAGASIIRGIYDNGTTAGRNFYHNSVYVGGTQTTTPSGNGTFAFQSTGVSNARTFQNNIFANARSNSGGTGKHYAVTYGGTTVNPTGLTAGGNIFLVSGTGGVFGLYNSADRADLSALQAATGQDATSYNVDPRFINSTGDATNVDLHLQTVNPAEAKGVALAAVTDDFDGQTRSNLTPVDIGADAGNFIYAASSTELNPVISFNPAANTNSTANRVLTGFATITDNVSVASGANAPRLYFKKSTEADAFVGNTLADNGWKYVTAANTASPYDFTVDYALLTSGASVGDVIQYFVVAQDGAANFVSSPSGAAYSSTAAPVTTVNARPATVQSYRIIGTNLSALALSSGTLSPGFAANVTSYTANVANTVSSLVVTPTPADSTATVTVNGSTPASPLLLDVGANAVSIVVTASDNTTKTYTVTVTRAAANNAPTAVGLSPSSVILSENANTSSAIELSTISITDDGVGSNTLSLSGTDAASFEIVADKLRLKAGVTLDFETKASYTVRVNVDDTTVGSTPDAFVDFTLNISDVNEAPTALSLSPTSAIFAENISTASAIELSTISFADDALGSNTLSLSGPDAASFEIVGGKLYLKAGAALDYETKTSLIVNVNVDDTAVGASPDASATFTLNLTNITELTGIDVQKGQSQRSFVRNVDILFDNDVGLTDLLSGNRVKLTRMDLNGLNRTAMTLPTNAVSGRQIQLDFGAQGIGGNRNSNVGDGYFEIAIDMDGDGLFESIKNFFRLYGDVTGDGIVDSRDKAQVMSMSGTTNVEGDLNGDGVVNLTDTTAVSRAVGRKLKAGLTWDD